MFIITINSIKNDYNNNDNNVNCCRYLRFYFFVPTATTSNCEIFGKCLVYNVYEYYKSNHMNISRTAVQTKGTMMLLLYRRLLHVFLVLFIVNHIQFSFGYTANWYSKNRSLQK